MSRRILLLAEKIMKDFKGVRALNSLDCTVENGHIHGIIGPDGSGKTTFFSVITGVAPANAGRIIFEGYFYKTIRKWEILLCWHSGT